MASDWRLSFFSPSLQLDYVDGVPHLLNRFTPCSENIQMVHELRSPIHESFGIKDVHFVATCHSDEFVLKQT